jgi:multiple sugar transport system ATP-binding protein
VREVEPLGGYTVVTIDAGESRLRATLRGQPDIRVNTRVALRCDPARAHFFGPGGHALARA